MMPAPAQAVAPYQAFARLYDAVLGDAMAPRIWQAFADSCRRYGIRFRRAADLGCGTGAFLARLARPGRRLFGVDRSPAMLALARDRLQGTGVTLLHQDLAALKLPEAVDLVTCNGATLNYASGLDHVGDMLRRMHENTVYGGWLIFDIILNNGVPAKNGREEQWIRLPGATAKWTIALDPAGTGSVVAMSTRLRQDDGRWAVFRETHRQRWFRLADILRLLTSLHWETQGTHRLDGDGSGHAAGSWLHVVARRR